MATETLGQKQRRFAKLVARLIDDADVRASMTQAARQQKTADAARALADVVMKAARQ